MIDKQKFALSKEINQLIINPLHSNVISTEIYTCVNQKIGSHGVHLSRLVIITLGNFNSWKESRPKVHFYVQIVFLIWTLTNHF